MPKTRMFLSMLFRFSLLLSWYFFESKDSPNSLKKPSETKCKMWIFPYGIRLSWLYDFCFVKLVLWNRPIRRSRKILALLNTYTCRVWDWYVRKKRSYTSTKSRNFTDVSIVGAQTCPPAFRNLAQATQTIAFCNAAFVKTVKVSWLVFSSFRLCNNLLIWRRFYL